MANYSVNYAAQKVTLTGEVNCDQDLKRILKTGKHAELEPAKADEKEVTVLVNLLAPTFRCNCSLTLEPSIDSSFTSFYMLIFVQQDRKAQVKKKKQEVHKAEVDPTKDPLYPVTFFSAKNSCIK